ncbi:MAG: Mrp/NBP35 family ATP-binding protein [Clostridia bacterium]|nr:Mrp/NBP35 family ATP-binding protein [Clostridia bacterium]
MSECSHDCSNCSKDCAEKKDLKAKLNEFSKVKKVIGIVSGKGGVGKSLVTSLLAITANKLGYKTAILDADITGPSIPKMFGITEKAYTEDGKNIYPAKSINGIKVMSVNLLLENDSDPVIWRGPVIAGVVKQFWTDVIWEDVDYMFVDMPPGTGDVPLTVFQSLPVDGIIVVTSPQQLVSMIVGKAAKMAKLMNIKIDGIVENMAYFKCPDCNKIVNIFGESKLEEIAKEYGIENYLRIPFDTEIASLSDQGKIEDTKVDLTEIFNKL